ncbi:hypothetical protein E0W68_01850 [Flavobacterium salilacus subsp. salilacus]|uniref:hypothetical protein n=1 Tax=Flavobacterium TaxID=237 RepID=UPI001074ADCB|nr:MULTISPECIES: hypothetical protein [Flavobacterium]KAF2519995.1 hypothetical protein E0W68_01850 [Flavobacterium salilacus subsp. salilacus]MBE1614091.1 hypothetical protein [Flavobacterium sp. SaA2.13]NDI97822.1 hypothetical protein [Flavobacterium salilacus subsp. altitudinum]
MKNVVYVLIVFFTVVAANAQCAMCRAALESSDTGIKPEAVNDGIVYLMIFPYLLVALIGYAIYRLRKKKPEPEVAE